MECRVRRAGGAVCITLPGMRPINPPHLTPDKQSVTPRARSRKLSAGRFSAAAVTLPIVGTSACKKPHAAGPPDQGPPRGRHLGAEASRRPRLVLPGRAAAPRSVPHRLRRWRLRLPPLSQRSGLRPAPRGTGPTRPLGAPPGGRGPPATVFPPRREAELSPPDGGGRCCSARSRRSPLAAGAPRPQPAVSRGAGGVGGAIGAAGGEGQSRRHVWGLGRNTGEACRRGGEVELGPVRDGVRGGSPPPAVRRGRCGTPGAAAPPPPSPDPVPPPSRGRRT